MILSENDYVLISIDESVPCLEWIGKKGFVPSEEFRLSEEESLKFYRQYKKQYPAIQWFVDARFIETVSPHDTQWLIDEILPLFAAAGLTKEAFVAPASALGKMTVNHYKTTAGQVIEIQTFDSVDAAKAWLKA